MSCQTTLEFYNICGHMVITEVCNRHGFFTPGRLCLPNCDIIVFLPTCFQTEKCPSCLGLRPGTPPKTTILVASPKLCDKDFRDQRWDRVPTLLQECVQRICDARRKVFEYYVYVLNTSHEKSKEVWEDRIAAFRKAERQFTHFKGCIFFENYDDSYFYRHVPLEVATADGDDCSVCLNPHDKDTKQLPCGHKFHEGCIKGWFQAQEANTCPLCRHLFQIFEMPEFGRNRRNQPMEVEDVEYFMEVW